jgi:hypothetical protein
MDLTVGVCKGFVTHARSNWEIQMTIPSPTLPSIDPNRWLECERALLERFTVIAESEDRSPEALKALVVEAIDAGWSEEEVRRALSDMIRAKGIAGEAGDRWLHV